MATSFVSIEFFPNRIQNLTEDPSSVVSTRVAQVAEVVHQESRRLIGTRYSGHHPNKPLKDSGGVVKIGTNEAWGVRYDHPAALMHHQGTPSHVIAPRRYGVMVRLGPAPVDKHGSDEFGPVDHPVIHPGTSPNRYLVDAARRVGVSSAGGSVAGQKAFLLTQLRGSGGRFTRFLT